MHVGFELIDDVSVRKLIFETFDDNEDRFRNYVSTVGQNEATIKKYIQEQEKADIIQDKLSVKNM